MFSDQLGQPISSPGPEREHEPAVCIHTLSKCFRIYKRPQDRLLQAVIGPRHKLFQEFWALRNVSLEVGRGEALGVIGRNGSGKSTLLQLICGTLIPTSGQVQISGRLGALLELGSGFNPEFTGRENIYLNASLLGLSKRRTDERLDDILAFADIGDFVDQPVKTYSSGMALRLAFAVQAHVDPDILIVDEALAVGDEMFQRKCFRRLEDLRASGTSILLVTHNCHQIIQYCDRAALLHRGRLELVGSPKEVTTVYQRLQGEDEKTWQLSFQSNPDKQARTNAAGMATMVYPSKGACVEAVEVLDTSQRICSEVRHGEGFTVRFHYSFQQDSETIQFGCNIATPSGIRITGQVYPSNEDVKPLQATNGSEIAVDFHFQGGLMPGLYFISGGIWSKAQPERYLHRIVDAATVRVSPTHRLSSFGLCDLMAAPASIKMKTHDKH